MQVPGSTAGRSGHREHRDPREGCAKKQASQESRRLKGFWERTVSECPIFLKLKNIPLYTDISFAYMDGHGLLLPLGYYE